MKKNKRSSIYRSKFVGITPAFLENFSDLPSSEREAPFYLLVTMLLIGGWDFHDPGRAFWCTQRNLRNALGWAYGTIRKHRQVLVDNSILSMERGDEGRYGNSLEYTISCDRLGIKLLNDRSKKKQNRPYIGHFRGMTRIAVDNVRKNIPHEKCPRALWLLANMLVMGDWNIHRAKEPFSWSERELAGQVGWARKTVRRYLNLLSEAKAIWVDSPGGRNNPTMYKADMEFLGIMGEPKAKQPTKIISFGKVPRGSVSGSVGTP